MTSELCNAYEAIGRIIVVEPDSSTHPLPHEQGKWIIEVLFNPEPPSNNKNHRVTYSKLRKHLNLSGKTVFKDVGREDEKDKDVYVPKAWQLLRKHLAKTDSELLKRMRLNRNLADAIAEALTYASTSKSLRNKLSSLGLSKSDLESLCALPYNSKVFKGYGARSLKALNMLVDALEDQDVTTLTDAERATGLLDLRLDSENKRLALLPPYSDFDPTCTNPVVLRSLSRMCHIINSIIRIYGIPDEIHIELGRELRLPKKARKQIDIRNQKNKKRKDEARKEIAELCGIVTNQVSPKQLLKYELYNEQGGKDAYYPTSENGLDLRRVLEDANYSEIDHILPFSRTADDSRANKALVRTSSNREKGQRSPYEWMTSEGNGSPNWDEFREAVLANRNYKPSKRSRLLNTSLSRGFDQTAFLDRNLNDTRYMSVAVKSYIEKNLAFPQDGKRHVFVVTGGATSVLRHSWGLNLGIKDEKDRTDDRHHAVDACVIAACNSSYVKKIAQASAKSKLVSKEQRRELFRNTEPWPGFAQDVRNARNKVIPTRFVDRGVTGSAFEETNYALVGSDERFDYLRAKKHGEYKLEKAGNAQIMPDGNVRKVGNLAFLRLWLDKEARSNEGKWLLEPVFFSDIPAIQNGVYHPTIRTNGLKRSEWPPLPDSAMSQRPIVVFPEDVLYIDGRLGRFKKINISNGHITYTSLIPGIDDKEVKMPSPAKWTAQTDIRVLQEDCLGHIYRNIDITKLGD